MIHTKENMEQMQGTSQETSSWVREVLEPDQLSSAKNMQHVGRRQLKPGTVIVLWALRLYVVLMMLIIAYQIWSVVQS
jgi:hypothetical protein